MIQTLRSSCETAVYGYVNTPKTDSMKKQEQDRDLEKLFDMNLNENQKKNLSKNILNKK